MSNTNKYETHIYGKIDHICILNMTNKVDSQSIGGVRNSYINFLSSLAQEKHLLVDNQSLAGLIVFLKFFNVISVRSTKNGIIVKTKSQFAGDFIKSLAIYLKSNFTLVPNWENPRSAEELIQDDILSWGSLFLRATEKRRISQSSTKQPISNVNIALLLIKAKVESYLNPMYLCQFNSNTLHFQLIGGYQKDHEKTPHAINRLLQKELPLCKLEKSDFTINKIQGNIIHYDIARKTNVYTQYNLAYHQIILNKSSLKLGPTDRWVSADELDHEKTIDGIPIMSPKRHLPNTSDVNEFHQKLELLPLSLNQVQPKGPNEHIKIIIPPDIKSTHQLNTILENEESEYLEFKSSLRWDYVTGNINKGLEKTIVRSIASLLNSNGGTLLIGVNDEKKVLGITRDLLTLKKKNIDGFFQHLISLISTHIGAEYTSFVQIQFEAIENETVCILKVTRSPNPVFTKEGESRLFYIRSGNSSRELNSQEVYHYINLHW